LRARRAVSERNIARAELHSIPSDWRILTLGDIATTQYGLTAASGSDGETAIVGMKDVVDGYVRFDDLPLVLVGEEERGKYELQEYDILFNRTNSPALVGKTGIVDQEPPLPAVFASYLVRVRVDAAKAEPTYLNHFMNSRSSRRQLWGLATLGVSQANINPSELRSRLLVPLPSIKEQQRIAGILCTWDRAIRKVEHLMGLKTELRRALAQRLLTGAWRFPGFSRTWEGCRLGDVFVERKETGGNTNELLALTANRGVIPRDEVERRDSSSSDKSNYKRVRPGDIVYNTMRMWQGVSALSRLEGIVSPAYTVCVPDERLDPVFVSYLFKLPRLVDLFRRHSQGLVDDTLTLRFTHFAQLSVVIPEVPEQRRIAAALDTLSREIQLLEVELDLLKNQKRGLAQKLLAGEVRVPVGGE